MKKNKVKKENVIKSKVFKLGFLQIGFSKGVWGISLFDKVSYINFFGVEILK